MRYFWHLLTLTISVWQGGDSLTATRKSMSVGFFLRYYLCYSRCQCISILDKPFFSSQNMNMSKPEGTNLSTLGLNNIVNYLDYFQGMYRSLLLVAT